MQLYFSETKLPNLKLKTRPKQLLGYLPLITALHDNSELNLVIEFSRIKISKVNLKLLELLVPWVSPAVECPMLERVRGGEITPLILKIKEALAERTKPG